MPFGKVRSDVAGIDQTDLGYTSQRQVAGLGLMDYRARMYDPGLGRFVQPDILMLDVTCAQCLNRYGYVANNSIRYSDPSGHWILETNNPDAELRRNAYLAAASRAGDAYSGHQQEYYLTAASYYQAVATDRPVDIEILSAQLEFKRDNLRRNGWNSPEDAVSAAFDAGGVEILGIALHMMTMKGATPVAGTYGDYVPANLADDVISSGGWVSSSPISINGRTIIGPFADLEPVPGYQRHHLVEKRFAPSLGLNPDDIPAVLLTPDEHRVVTNQWRNEIPYRNSSNPLNTSTASAADILRAAENIYSNNPEYLRAIQLLLGAVR